MRGRSISDLAEEYRQYELVRLTGWTLDQIDDAPAMTLDWMLACDRATAEAVNRRADAAKNQETS